MHYEISPSLSSNTYTDKFHSILVLDLNDFFLWYRYQPASVVLNVSFFTDYCDVILDMGTLTEPPPYYVPVNTNIF